MNVLIADDEEDVLLGLTAIIDWNNLGCNICATATDGEETLNKLRLFHPNLVLIDIKMPRCNGLELIKKARKNGFEGEFIILSGYSDFSFAQTAINLGVSDYLVKPVDEDELTAAVLKVGKNFKKRRLEKNQFNTYKECARESILVNLITGKRIAAYDLHDLSIEADQYMLVLLGNRNNGSQPQETQCLKRALERTEKGIGSHAVESVLIQANEYLLLSGRRVISSFYRLLENWSGRMQEHSPLGALLIIYGRPVFDVQELVLSYRDVNALKARRFYCKPSQHVLSYKDLPTHSGAMPSSTFWEHTVSAVTAAIFAHNRNLVAAELESLEFALDGCSATEGEIKQALKDMFLQIKQRLLCCDISLSGSLPSNSAIMSSIDEKMYLYEIVSYFSEQINICMNLHFSDVLDNIIYYIDHNYSNRELRLETLATLFGYSSNYLGKMFSKKVGENFNTYLDHVRIDSAIKMLEKKSVKVCEISERVGYSDVNYFYKKFKKYTGVTPTEYRNSSHQGSDSTPEINISC